MNSDQYLKLLWHASTGPVDKDEDVDMAKVRSEQTGVPYSQWVKNKAKDKKDIFSAFNNLIVKPLLNALPVEVSSKIKQIPIGILPIRSVNAHALKAPNGEPLIILDWYLTQICGFYMETFLSQYILHEKIGNEKAIPIVDNAYLYIINYFRKKGHSTPPNRIKMQIDKLGVCPSN